MRREGEACPPPLVNYHFHDEASADARGTLEEHCRRALRAGISELCITNHVETLGPEGEWRVDPEEARGRFSRTLRAVQAARERFPALRIGFGAEFEWRPGWTEALDRLRRSLPFDLIIGSLHYLDGFNISGGGRVDRYFQGRSQEQAYRRYFQQLGEMVDWGGFHVVGHFDLVKRYGHLHYGPYRPEAFQEAIRAVLHRMGRRGIGLEVNASGIFQAPGSAYPEIEILKWAREHGIEILTVGNDAHRPEDIGRGLADAVALARRAGWRQPTLFRSGVPRRASAARRR